jgi:hypothetical protein
MLSCHDGGFLPEPCFKNYNEENIKADLYTTQLLLNCDTHATYLQLELYIICKSSNSPMTINVVKHYMIICSVPETF